MSADGGVPRSSSQVFIVLVRNMTSIELIFLGKSEIDHEYLVAFVVLANKKIVRFDVPMNESLGVNVLYPL